MTCQGLKKGYLSRFGTWLQILETYLWHGSTLSISNKPSKKGCDLVVFATAALTIIPLKNTGGKKLSVSTLTETFEPFCEYLSPKPDTVLQLKGGPALHWVPYF